MTTFLPCSNMTINSGELTPETNPKNKMTPTYQLAVQSIRTYVDAKQSHLDATASIARANHLVTLRTNTLDSSDPLFPLVSLIVQTVTVGRSDGYPEVMLPDETKAVIRAAFDAGLVVVDTHHHLLMIGPWQCRKDASGLTLSAGSEWDDDYRAWNASLTYRVSQTVATL